MNPPMIVGHEFSGVVVACGEGVEEWEKGARVTAEPSAIICGKCRYCRTGAYNMCSDRLVTGYWVNGGFAEYVVVGAHRLHRPGQRGALALRRGAFARAFQLSQVIQKRFRLRA
jgi:L-iditol 2-dehydrogenase